MNKNGIILVFSLLLFSCNRLHYEFEFMDVDTPGNTSLRAICAVDENIVWTSGSQGQLWLTLDGGEHWSQLKVPGCEHTEFRSLHAWDGLRALVFDISPEGRAFLTSDGGLSWEQVYRSPSPGAFFNSLKFADDRQGVAISDPVDDRVFILRTEDGGRNWKRLATTPPTEKGEINFAASNTCIAYLASGAIYIVTGGRKARVLSSKDHGNHWAYVDTPVMTGESAGLFSINFPDPGNGVAVGGDFSDPDREGIRAIYTENGGIQWHAAESMPAGYRSCVVSLNDKLLFATGKTGSDYSADRGKNWVPVDTVGYYTACAVAQKNLIYLAGSEGRVAKVTIR